jgi:hypothetical protein
MIWTGVASKNSEKLRDKNGKWMEKKPNKKVNKPSVVLKIIKRLRVRRSTSG